MSQDINTVEISSDVEISDYALLSINGKLRRVSIDDLKKILCSDLENNINDMKHSARIGEVTLTSNGWTGSGSLYSQVVNIEGVTENSQVDLTPSVQQLVVFYEKDLTFVTENVDGVVTVYAIGQKPSSDYTIQVTITEVSYE